MRRGLIYSINISWLTWCCIFVARLRVQVLRQHQEAAELHSWPDLERDLWSGVNAAQPGHRLRLQPAGRHL